MNFTVYKLHLNKGDFKMEKQAKGDTHTIEKETQDDVGPLD